MIRSKEARARARQVLQMVGITEPPVDVRRVAEFLGFSVIEFPFEGTSGYTFIEGDLKTIGVNSAHAPTRQRFSIAHELGHYLSGHEGYDHGRGYVEGMPSWLDPQNRQEAEADDFAAELLMPDPFLKRDLGAERIDTPTLARRYQVNEQAMWIQLINLKLAAPQDG